MKITQKEMHPSFTSRGLGDVLTYDYLLLNIQITLIIFAALSIALMAMVLGHQFQVPQRTYIFISIIVFDLALALNLRSKYLFSLVITICATFIIPWIAVLYSVAQNQSSIIPLMFLVIPIQISSLFLSLEVLLPLTIIQVLSAFYTIMKILGVKLLDSYLACIFIFAVTTLSLISSGSYQKQKRIILDSMQDCIKNGKRLQDESIRDSLTGLFNRRYLDEVLDELTESSNPNFSLLMIDIDHFKMINDTYGHVVGDGVLKQVAEVLTNSHRPSDVSCRYGGDEFMVILINCGIKDAVMKAEAIRELVERSISKEVSGSSKPVTVSIGVAHCPSCAKDKENIIRIVDEMLYEAKQTGRNRVVRKQLSNFC